MLHMLCLLACVVVVAAEAEVNVTSPAVIRDDADTTADQTAAATAAPDEKNSTEASIRVPVLYGEAEAARLLDLYGGALILFFGTIGNSLSIILLRRKRLRSSTTSLYLVALAATDLVQVVTGQATRHWVRSLTGTDPPVYSTWYCKIWFYIIRVANSYSNWVLAGVTAERCIVILIPLRSKTFITRTSAKIFLCGSLVVVMAYYCHSFVSYLTIEKPFGKVCMANLDNYFVVEIRPWVDWVLEALVPGLIILICNCVIISTLIKARAKRATSLAQGQKNDQNDMTSLVVMLVSVSIAYLILTTPMHVNFVLSTSYPAGYWFVEHSDAVKRLFWAISLFMHYTNHSINFLLYVLTGREFRLELRALVGRTCFYARRRSDQSNANKTSQITTTSGFSASSM